MDKMNSTLIVGVLALIALVGVIVLAVLEMDTQVLLPILTILVGFLVGRKQNVILGAFKK
jgi:hypothetical protein